MYTPPFIPKTPLKSLAALIFTTMATLLTLFKPTMIHTLILYLLLLHPLATTSRSIHELLRSRGLPAGLFPKNGVESYELDENDQLQVYLESPCVAKFETRVFFDSVVRANLSYGGLTGVEGLSQEELFLWLPVKDIIVSDPSSGIILIDIGLALKKLSLSLFEEPPICIPQDVLMEKNLARRSSNWKFEK